MSNIPDKTSADNLAGFSSSTSECSTDKSNITLYASKAIDPLEKSEMIINFGMQSQCNNTTEGKIIPTKHVGGKIIICVCDECDFNEHVECDITKNNVTLYSEKPFLYTGSVYSEFSKSESNIKRTTFNAIDPLEQTEIILNYRNQRQFNNTNENEIKPTNDMQRKIVICACGECDCIEPVECDITRHNETLISEISLSCTPSYYSEFSKSVSNINRSASNPIDSIENSRMILNYRKQCQYNNVTQSKIKPTKSENKTTFGENGECDVIASVESDITKQGETSNSDNPFSSTQSACSEISNSKSNINHNATNSTDRWKNPKFVIKYGKSRQCKKTKQRKIKPTKHKRRKIILCPCGECDFNASVECGNTKQNGIQHGDKPFACTGCSYRSATKSHLTLHTSWIHSGKKPFACPMCNYRAATKRSVTRHERVHTDDAHACTFCNYRTVYSASLTEHMRTHTGEKPFDCSQCSFRTAVKKDLIRHTRTHTGERPFSCSHCYYKAYRQGELNRHIFNIHCR